MKHRNFFALVLAIVMVVGAVNALSRIPTAKAMPTELDPGQPIPTEPAPTQPEEPEVPTEPTEPETEPTEPPAPVPQHQHSYSVVETKATCTQDGVKVFTCACGASYTETIEKLGHAMGDWYVSKEADYGVAGEMRSDCTRCEYYETKPIDPLVREESHEHDYQLVDKLDPTCEDAGYNKYACECGDSYTDEIPALGHNHHISGNDASCTEKGHHHDECSRCHKVFEDYDIEAKDHNMGEWSGWQDNGDGREVSARVCSRCAHTEYQYRTPQDACWDLD